MQDNNTIDDAIPFDTSADDALNQLYASYGVDSKDIDARLRMISGIIRLTNWNYLSDGQPPLYMLEEQYLRDNNLI